MEDRIMSRRLQILRVDAALLKHWLTGGAMPYRYLLPADVSVITILPGEDVPFELRAVLHSAEFPVVPINSHPPLWVGMREDVPDGATCPQCGAPVTCACGLGVGT